MIADHSRAIRRAGSNTVVDRHRERRRPRRRHVGAELELGAAGPQQRHRDLEQPDLERLLPLDRPREVADLARAQRAVDEVERAVDLAPAHHQHAADRGALDQAEDLGQREELEGA